MPYRIAAPPPIEPPDAEEPYAAVIRAEGRRARIVLAAAVALLVAGGAHAASRSKDARRAPPRVTEASRAAAAHEAIFRARDHAAAAQVRFESSVREAIGADVVPRSDLGACPIRLPEASSAVRGRSAFPLLTIERAELKDTLPSQAIAEVLADVRRAERHLAAGRYEEATLYARALERPERLGFDVVLVAKSAARPRAVSGSEYVPGEIAGRAYLYDFASGRVVCAADVEAKSSKAVGYVFSDHADAPPALGPLASMGDAISEDLRRETERAIARAMRFRAGPAAADL